MLETASVGDLLMMRGQSGAASIYEGVGAGGVHSLYVPEPGSQTRLNGHLLEEGQAAFLFPNAQVQLRSRNPGLFLGIDIPSFAVEHLLMKRRRGRAGAKHSDVRVLRLPKDFSDVFKIVFLGLEARGRATSDIQTIRARLISTVTAALANSDGAAAPRRPASRAAIVSQAMAHMDACLGTGETLAGLSAALHVSQRSLNRAFSEAYDMSPQRYAGLVRLHAIRRALRTAKATATVTNVATRFNAWDSGRMASAYRELFGLYPSDELHQALSRQALSRL